MGRKLRTISSHQRSFEVAPAVKPGERVRLVRLEEAHPGWCYGCTLEGTEGYFPTDWFEIDAGEARALRAYDATELTIEPHLVVEGLEEYGGWCLVETTDKSRGWVPVHCVAADESIASVREAD